MNRFLLLVGVGGFLGSISRYSTQLFIARIFPTSFPLGTLTVNIFGCFVAGIIYGMFEKSHVLSPEWRFFLATGFCGGYTTFSAFSHESIGLLNAGQWFNLSLYVGLSVVVGLLATFLGMSLVKAITL